VTSGWATVVVAASVALAVLIGWSGRWLIRLLIGTFKFIYVEWPNVAESIGGLRTEIAAIKAETQPNDGRSLRDVIQHIREDVADVKQEQAAVRRELLERREDAVAAAQSQQPRQHKAPPD